MSTTIEYGFTRVLDTKVQSCLKPKKSLNHVSVFWGQDQFSPIRNLFRWAVIPG
jgi:hypothetical protein